MARLAGCSMAAMDQQTSRKQATSAETKILSESIAGVARDKAAPNDEYAGKIAAYADLAAAVQRLAETTLADANCLYVKVGGLSVVAPNVLRLLAEKD